MKLLFLHKQFIRINMNLQKIVSSIIMCFCLKKKKSLFKPRDLGWLFCTGADLWVAV